MTIWDGLEDKTFLSKWNWHFVTERVDTLE